MEPDPRQLLICLLSSALCALFALYSGMNMEESSREEETDSGLGVSYDTVTGFLLSASFAAAACVFFRLFLISCSVSGAPLWCFTALFGVLAVSLLFFAPLFIGQAKSEKLEKKLNATEAVVKVLSWPVRLLLLPTNLLIKSMGVEEELTEITEEDVMELVETAEEDEIDPEQKEMISNILELDDAECGDILVHRTEMTAVSCEAPLDEVIRTAVSSGFSRIPVYRDSLDDIIGVYLVKDLLPYVLEDSDDPVMSEIVRPVTYVPETYKASQLLRDFKEKKNHLAVVVDEYGGTAGIVTLEDILETVVGDIEDEFDVAEEKLKLSEDGTLECDGHTEIADVYEVFGLDMPEGADGEYDTIGGLVTDQLGFIPTSEEGASCICGGLRITVTGSDGKKVTSVKAERFSLPSGDGEDN